MDDYDENFFPRPTFVIICVSIKFQALLLHLVAYAYAFAMCS